MRIIRFNKNLLEQCVEFWWGMYEQKPYIVRPDGYQDINNPPVACDVFRENLRSGLNGGSVRHWRGVVTPDSIILAEDNGKIAGMLVCSVDRENLVGTILSGFMHQDQRGREVAELLVSEALEHFRKLGLRRAVVGWLAWVCICGLEVIPSYRRRGIGTVLLHLVTDEMVRGGGEYDCTVLEVTSPARVLLHSAGYQYWYLGFGGMSMAL